MSTRRASSRNALTHGLTALKWAQVDRQRVSAIEQVLTRGSQEPRIIKAAKRAAEAREVLERVTAARQEALHLFLEAARMDLTGGALVDNPGQLQACGDRLDSLRRYERQAMVRWERAIAELEAAELERPDELDFSITTDYDSES
jgi:hypothetical protein